mgnify:FL=1
MSTLVIKNFPEQLHAKLKVRAAEQHRSMGQEAIVLIDAALGEPPQEVRAAPRSHKGRFLITQTFIDDAKRAGRS